MFLHVFNNFKLKKIRTCNKFNNSTVKRFV